MCGDATNRDDVFKLVDSDTINLVHTDPPWGIIVQRSDGRIGSKGTIYKQCIGDDSTETARKNYEIIDSFSERKIIWGGHYFTEFLPRSAGWLFWDKLKTSWRVFGDGELAWQNCTGRIHKYVHKWDGFVMSGRRALNKRVHPMQKPVELIANILQDFSSENDVILDCFGGSGTTLIACELIKP